MSTFRIAGSPQVVRRSRRAASGEGPALLKVCLQRQGCAVLHQNERELVIAPGQLAVYDTGLPYDLRLDGDSTPGSGSAWQCDVMTLPADALALPSRWIRDLMGQRHDASSAPGTVLTSFIGASLAQFAGPSDDSVRTRFGRAGVDLLASTLTLGHRSDPVAAPDALRLQVMEHLRRNVGDPSLTHASIAAAHGVSPRTLDRLFEDEEQSVTAALRGLRLEGARRQLEDPRSAHHSIAVIAASWCFVDQGHFSRAFKAHYGVSPSAVRPRGDDVA